MHGDGISPATTKADVGPPRLLDLTRSLRRAGRQPTGVDRVERAYLAHLLADDVPLYGLVRTALGYLLIDQKGAHAFLNRLEGRADWPAVDIVSRLSRGRDAVVASAETSLRQGAVARCLPPGLARMLARHFGQGFDFFNVGHSNLTDRVLSAVKSAGGQLQVLIHDVIPLEHPEYQRPGTVAPFREKMQLVGRLADRIIYNSEDTRQRAEAQLSAWGAVPPAVVAHLGTISPNSDLQQVPPGVLPGRPYFIAIGTIEPRKNHAFLLDLWDQFGADAPPLLICGTRGWNNDAVFRRLDALPDEGPIREVPGLSDPALLAVLEQSAGLLFPSHAEGYGLPILEAAALGVRVLCNDLPVFHEFFDCPLDIVSVTDSQTWLRLIKSWDKEPRQAGKATRFESPTWADHFNTVLKAK